MNNDNNQYVASGGIGFFGLLTILFIGLKLTNYVTWSWFWVLSPLFLPTCIIVAFVAIVYILILIEKVLGL